MNFGFSIFNLAIAIAIAKTSEGSGDTRSLLLGTYRLTSELSADTFIRVLRAMGFGRSQRERFLDCPKLVLEISKDALNSLFYVKTYQCKCFESPNYEFESNSEFDLVLCDGRKVKTIVTEDDSRNIITKTMNFGDFKVTEISKFSQNGMTIIYNIKDTIALLKFERIYGLISVTADTSNED